MSPATDQLIRQVQLQEALLKVQAEKSLGSFIEQAWATLEPSVPFSRNWHIDYVVEHLEAVTAGEIKRLLVNMPPRSMKSLLISVFWPTWEWLRNPGGRWIFASYAESLALKHSLDRRTILQSDWFQSRWGDRVCLAVDQNEKREFQNTARGHMIATSVLGPILGKGGNRIVVDDPHNTHQVESDVQREAAIASFKTLSTRLDNKNKDAIVLAMQRLHPSDLSAVYRDLGCIHLNLPAEAEARTTIVFPSGREHTRALGDVLWPEREDSNALAEQKRVMGATAYAAQYQQSPVPAGGLLFQRECFNYYDALPRHLDWAISWDMSFKDKADSDFVVGIVAARVGADVYIVDRVRGQWSFSETLRQVKQLHWKYPQARTILIEDAANGTAIVDVLKHVIPGIIPVSPQGGKLARAQAVQPSVEAGNIYLPNPRPEGRLIPERAWVDEFLYQLTCFPNGAHDDDVDAFTQLIVRWQRPRGRATWGS